MLKKFENAICEFPLKNLIQMLSRSLSNLAGRPPMPMASTLSLGKVSFLKLSGKLVDHLLFILFFVKFTLHMFHSNMSNVSYAAEEVINYRKLVSNLDILANMFDNKCLTVYKWQGRFDGNVGK